MGPLAVGTHDAEGDPAPGWWEGNLVDVRTSGRARHKGIAGHRAGGDVEQQGGVTDRPGDGVVDAERIGERPEPRKSRRSSARGLEAEEAAGRRRDAERAAPVVAVAGRNDAGCDRGRRPTRGAPGRVRQSVGVPYRTTEDRLGGGVET